MSLSDCYTYAIINQLIYISKLPPTMNPDLRAIYDVNVGHLDRVRLVTDHRAEKLYQLDEQMPNPRDHSNRR